MKKKFILFFLLSLLTLLFPTVAFADSYDSVTHTLTIETTPTVDFETSVNSALGTYSAFEVINLIMTSDVNYTMTSADQNYLNDMLSLRNIDIASTVLFDANGDGITGDIQSGFGTGPSSLISVNIGSAESFGTGPFAGLTELVSVSLPSAVSLGDSAFDGCTSLSSVELPLVTSVGDYAFYGCTSLETLDLPSVTSVGSLPFYMCTSLKTLNMPVVTSLGSNMFAGCSQAIELTLGTTVPASNMYTFDSYNIQPVHYTMNAASIVRVPEGSYIAYDSYAFDSSGTSDDGLWFGWRIEAITVPVVVPVVVNPQTGDSTSLGLWLLMILPVGMGVYIYLCRKKITR